MAEESKRRVLLIGIDGATWRLLGPMIDKGLLPNLARLRDHGAWGELESTIPPVTAPAWTTFQTGVLPGKHGTVDFNIYTADSYRTHPVSSADISLPTLWEQASQADKRLVVVNVPVTFPPRPVNGCMVTGMLTPDLETKFTYPAELSEEIRNAFPNYQILTPQTVFNTSSLEDFISKCIRTERVRASLFQYLVDEHCPDWDVAMLHIQELDVIQHAIYWWLDETSRHFEAEKYAVAVGAYQAIDSIVGELIPLMKDNTLTVILSDHGHGPIYKTVNVNSLLAREGLATFSGKRSSDLVRRAIGLALRLDRWNLNRMIGRKRRRKLVDSLNQQIAVDWEQTRAFMLNGWVWANIYINVEGRDPQGVVKPGHEYEQVRQQVTGLLSELRDPETGESVVQKVLPREIAFPGADGPFPDLIGVPEDGYEFSSSFYQDAGDIFRANRMKRDHTGSHSLDGILLLSGSMVVPGAIAGARLVDLFPTILAWLGIPVPSYVDGRVVQDAFAIDLPIQWQESEERAEERAGPNQPYSEEEIKVIEDRLRALGYM